MKILSLFLIICCCFKKSKCNIFIDGLRGTIGLMIEGSGCGSSSRSSKISSQTKNDYEYSDKNKLLNSTIKNMILGMYPLLPTMTFIYHTFALLNTSEGYILLEYGQYNKDNDYHYYYDNEGGVRFKPMSYNDFKKKSKRNVPLNIEKEMTLESLLKNVSSIMGLKFKDYNAGDNNCQDFMKNVIYFLCAKRPLKDRKIHILDKLKDAFSNTLHIPFIILEKIECNEQYGCYKGGVRNFDDYDNPDDSGISRNYYYSRKSYYNRQPQTLLFMGY